MPKLLTTKHVSAAIEELITSCTEKLVLISPYWQLSNSLLNRLKDASQRGVQITIVYGKEELKQAELEKIHKIKNAKIYFCENLHAKCYYNENFAIISSMNLHEFSEKNNIELGIALFKGADQTLYNAIITETEYIINKESVPEYGHCIRCGCEIPFDPTHPMCYNCYQIWNNYKNPVYTETFCHKCGESCEDIYICSPLCENCTDE